MIRKEIRPAIVLTLLICLITGFLYPGVVTVLAQLLFPSQANGSIVLVEGKPVGSRLLGQPFTAPYYFHPGPPRPVAGTMQAPPVGPTRDRPTSSWRTP
jgi:K+-transporting ATPase ATPase C chain